MSKTGKVQGRVTLTRLIVVTFAWVTYAGLVLPMQAIWFLIERLALKREDAHIKVWKPSVHKWKDANKQPSMARDAAGMWALGPIYVLREMRKQRR